MFYKKVCNYGARRRAANQYQAKHGADWRPILSLRVYLAWKIGRWNSNAVKRLI